MSAQRLAGHRVLLTGASGLLGSALRASLSSSGAKVVQLVRRPPAGPGEVQWDPTGKSSVVKVPESLDGVTAASARGGTAKSYSPERWSAARLVLSTLRCPHAARRSLTSGAATSRCSKLSRMSSSRFSFREAKMRSRSGGPPVSRMPSVCAMAGTIRPGSCNAASGTKKNRPGNRAQRRVRFGSRGASCPPRPAR